jgi:PAS domain S-box-containing protein
MEGVDMSMENLLEALTGSDQHFQKIIDALPAAIYLTDAEGRVTQFNQACVAFSGRVPELGTDHWCVTWKLYRPDGTPLPHDECPMAIALKEGRPIRGAEAIAERPDGTRIWFTPYPTPLRDVSGRIIGGINMLVDITERKRAEEAHAFLASIVASSYDAIVSKTLDGIVTSWNDGAEQIFGYSAEEMIGQPIRCLIPAELQDEEDRILAQLREGRRIEHFETVRLSKDRRRIEVSLTISPVRDSAGRIIGASKIARDISDRKRAEVERERLVNQLEEKQRKLQEVQSVLLDKIQDLETFHDVAVERELKLVEMEREMQKLRQQTVVGDPVPGGV